MMIRIQTEDFDVGFELMQMRQSPKSVGAIVSFLGVVRDLNEGASINTLTLEHYPKMTEKALASIADQATKRWDLQDILIIHRVGKLEATDQIVFVAVSSAHRHEAFQACEFVMDYLKTQAPFWKKEQTDDGVEHWVEAKQIDEVALKRWN